MTNVQEGDTVSWIVGEDRIFERKAQGTVIETGVSKFGYDDIIVVDCPTDPADETYIRPKDLR